MADEKGATDKPASVNERTKAAAEGLKKLLDLIAPETKPKDETTASKTTPVVDEVYGAISSAEITHFTEMARSAVERYRNSMRWLVGAVAAIALALFGSTAFTEGDAFDSVQGWVGLVLASLGLVLILTAVTLVFEPEDASLGELASDFARAEAKLNKWGWLKRLKLWAFPRLAATSRLKDILSGVEGEAHLGPGHQSVTALIQSIGTQQKARGENARDLANHRRWMAANASKRAVASADLNVLLEARKSLDKTKTDYGPELNQPIAELINLTKALRDEADREFRELATKQGSLEQADYQLGMDLLHRSVVLAESGVAQLRGTFRLSRRCLLIGAVLTLLGALLYIVGVKDDDTDDSASARRVRAGTLIVAPGSPVADEFTGKCVNKELSVTYFGESTPKVADAFTITVSAPEECAGTYTIPGGRSADDARVVLAPPVTVPKAE